MKKLIEKELRNLPKGFVVLTIVPSEESDKINSHILNLLTKNNNGTYISITKPYTSIIQSLERKKINHSNLFFIDCITENISSMDTKDFTNCVFISSPADLTNLSIAIEEELSKSKSEFVFLDSINTLSIYNRPKILLRFLHTLVNKIRLHNIKGVIISMREESDEKLLNQVSELCDKVIKF